MMVRQDERSLGELFSELSRETSTLVRQEIELAKVEMTGKAKRFGKNATFVALGGAVAYVGLIALVFMLIFLLDEFLPLWVSALIVGLVVAGVGYALIQKGLAAIRETNMTPERTIETLKEDTQWAKEQIR